jgi:Cu+-exporting ATPase
METITLSIAGMSCSHCVASVRSALAAVPGVAVEDVRLGSATVRGDATPATTAALLAAVEDAGYEATVGDAPAPAGLTTLTARRSRESRP